MLEQITISEIMLNSNGVDLKNSNIQIDTTTNTLVVDDLMGEVVRIENEQIIIPTIESENEEGAVSILFRTTPQTNLVDGATLLTLNEWSATNKDGVMTLVNADDKSVVLNVQTAQIANSEWHQMIINANGNVVIDGDDVGSLEEQIDMTKTNIVLGGTTIPATDFSEIKVFSRNLSTEDAEEVYKKDLTIEVADVDGKKKPLNSEMRIQKMDSTVKLDAAEKEEKLGMLNHSVMGRFREEFQFTDGSKQYTTETITGSSISIGGTVVEVGFSKQIPQIGLPDVETITEYLKVKEQLKEELLNKILNKEERMKLDFEAKDLLSNQNLDSSEDTDSSEDSDSSKDSDSSEDTDSSEDSDSSEDTDSSEDSDNS